jgi:hypothetical protein
VKDTLVAFREINKFQRKHQEDLNRKCKTSSAITGQFQNHGLSENQEEWNDEPTEEDWKTILGFYLLENSLRTDAAFVEILKNISNWGWTIQDTKELIKNTGNSNNEHISKFTTPEENTGEELTKEKELSYYYIPNPNWNKIRYDQMANIIRETSDPYQMAYFQIMNTFEKLNSLLNENKLNDEQKDECFEKLRKIYCLFGGYEYIQAFEKAKKFFEGIYQNGSANVTLKSNGSFYRPSFSGDITKEDATIPEDAIVTEIINSTSLKVNNLLHIDENGKKEEFCLNPYFTLKINEQEKKVYVIGQWNVQHIDADYYSLPKEINLKVKWKAPLNNPIKKAE